MQLKFGFSVITDSLQGRNISSFNKTGLLSTENFSLQGRITVADGVESFNDQYRENVLLQVCKEIANM